MTAIKRMIPNLFTAGNLIGGILAIVLALNGFVAVAPYFIFISAIFDFLDGFMARLLKVPSELGKQLDSLADMVTFGVAPGIIVMVLLSAPDIEMGAVTTPESSVTEFIVNSQLPNYGEPVEITSVSSDSPNSGGFTLTTYLKDGPKSPMTLFGCLGLIIPVFALFRLAKFNLDTRQSDAFIGLPTPGMTLFFASLPILFHHLHIGIIKGEVYLESWQFLAGKFMANPWVLLSFVILLSLLMVAELPLFALKFKHFKWKGNEIRFIFLTCCVVLLATLFVWAIPLIIILYLILSLINTRIAKSETKTNEI